MEPVSLNMLKTQDNFQVLREFYGFTSQIARETVLNATESDKRVLKESISQINSLLKENNEDAQITAVNVRKIIEIAQKMKQMVDKIGVELKVENKENQVYCRILNEINGREIATIPLHILLSKLEGTLAESMKRAGFVDQEKEGQYI